MVILGKPGRKISSNAPKAIAQRDERTELRSRGICPACRKRKSRKGWSMCLRCQVESKQRQRRLAARRRAAGECLECGSPANFKARCPACVKRRNARPSRHHSYRKAEYAARYADRRK